MNEMTRRKFLLSVPALAMAPRVFAQGGAPAIPVKALNHFTLSVSDVKRSVDFYQGLFGLPIQARQGSTVLLRIGNGPQFLAVRAAGSDPPSIVSQVCMTVENFGAERIIGVLGQHGITRAAPGDPGLSGGPMKVRVSMRGPENGGAPGGTPELYLGDPDGFILQLQDTTYCGGAGALGNVCPAAPEPPPKKGLIAVKDISHFTIAVSDANRSNTFYQELFGLPIRSRQGPATGGGAPGLGIGPGVGFIMFTGGAGRGRAGAPPRPANVNHVCMNMENFNPDDVLKTLAGFGITARGDATAPAGPMKSYISLRMENRGGAPGGTPELYFTDPDGLAIQLQDVKYCGGGGFLGELCPPLPQV
jgi:catechol 2,3-dioxygenase-like lactoylglutathione lyase family enzyme